MLTSRRALLAALPATLIAVRAGASATVPPAVAAACIAAEKASGGRFGLAVNDLASGQRYGIRAAERFGLASTFKFLLCAAVLEGVDRHEIRLDRELPVTATDLLSNSPTTETLVGRSASVEILCEAAMTVSDNAAANLLLPLVGGPAGVTAFVRKLGDLKTRLDRNEPSLNVVPADEVRDTTSPDAMLDTMAALLLGPVLRPESRAKLTGWLVDNRTGAMKLRAGLPAGWRVGDKTGAWGKAVSNDIAVAWPTPGKRPLLITAYISQAAAAADVLSAQHATVARAVAASLTR